MTVDDLDQTGRREFLRKMAMVGAFVVPGVASYAMRASADTDPASGTSNSSDPGAAAPPGGAPSDPSSGSSNSSDPASGSSNSTTTTTVAPTTTTTVAPTTTTTTVPEEVVEEEDVDLTSTALPSTK